jgi:hypothetical protein
MAIRWREDLKRRWAVVVYADPFTADEFQRVMTEILAHPISAPPLRLLVDRRYCSAPMPEFINRVVAFADGHRDRLNGARVALVVANDAAHGNARSVELTGEAKQFPVSVQPFREWTDAERWLERSE